MAKVDLDVHVSRASMQFRMGTGVLTASAYITPLEVKEKMYRINVGIDVSKDDFEARAKNDRNQEVMSSRTYSNDKEGMLALKKDGDNLKEEYGEKLLYGMESTGIYHRALCQFLREQGEDVKVFNGLETKGIKDSKIRKTKTDEIDAGCIAEALILATEPSHDRSKDPLLEQIREQERLRARLMKKYTKCKIQADRALDMICQGYTDVFNDIFCQSSIEIIKETVRKTRLFEVDKEKMTDILEEYMDRQDAEEKAQLLKKIFQNAVVPKNVRDACITEIHMLIQQYQLFRKQKERTDRKIEKLLKEYDPYMSSVPGLGPVTVATILGELGNPSRFPTGKQVTAFAGLDPSVKQSGKMKKEGKISKRGPPHLREALYNATISAVRHNPVCKEFYDRLIKKGKCKKVARVAVARKLLLIAWSVEKNQKEFYVPSYVSEEYISKEN